MILSRQARPTLTAVELDRGDTLRFACADGHVVTFVLRRTSAGILHSDLPMPKVEQRGAITPMRFWCTLEVDGTPVELVRELCTPAAFYEPWVLSGVRVWFDAVDDLFEFLDETHGACRPRKHARFALQDAGMRICPPPVQPWCPLAEEGLDIRECYNGDDCWLGGYFGTSAHGGLDINHPRGTPIWAPIDLDDQWLFHRVPAEKNNRWRGVRRWDDGSTWTLQTHHLVRLTVAEHTPVRAGQQVAVGAGVWVGGHDHSHFVFKVRDGDAADDAPEYRQGRDLPTSDILLDPWILFWQMYRDRAGGPACFYRRSERGLFAGHYP